MEKVEVAYLITKNTTDSFVLKSVFASLAGASIPAVIFYFLMWQATGETYPLTQKKLLFLYFYKYTLSL